MRLPVTAVLAVVLVAISGCSDTSSDPISTVTNNTGSGLWTADNPNAVSFELQQVFGQSEEPVEATLASPVSATADADGNVYILDAKDARLVSFDADGKFRWASGRLGTGPGEFENAFEVIAGRSELFVSNLAGTRIDQFSFAGDYLRSIKPSELGASDRGTVVGFETPTKPILINFVPGKTGARLTVFDLDADSVSHQFEIDISDDLKVPPMFGLTPDVAWSGGLITRGHFSKYEHGYYSIDGRLVRTVGRDVNPFLQPGVRVGEQGSTMRIFSTVRSPRSIGPDRWLSVASWPTNVQDSDAYMKLDPEAQPEINNEYCVDVFDDAGTLLWSRIFDGETPFGDIAQTTDDGLLYTIASTPFPQVRRYRVHINS